MDERRRFFRYDCYMIVNKKRGQIEEEDFFGIVYNISSGGALIECEHSIKMGQLLSLAFILDDQEQVWEGKGRVIWVDQKEEKIHFGLEFIEQLEEHWQERILDSRGETE